MRMRCPRTNTSRVANFFTQSVVITDSADAPGGVWFNPGYIRALDVDDRSWGDLRASSGPAARPELPRQFGQMPAVALVDQIEAGSLRALFVLGGNLTTSMPDVRSIQGTNRGA